MAASSVFFSAATDPVALIAAAGTAAEFSGLSEGDPLLGYRLALPAIAFDPSDVSAGLQAGVALTFP